MFNARLRIALCFALFILISMPALAKDKPAGPWGPSSWTYSPLTAVGVGPSGPATSMISVEPFCCPSTAVVLNASQAVAEDDFQWVNLGLPGPQRPVTAVEVCYSVETAQPGSTYISQTRITDMTTPDQALVLLDDDTNRTDVGPSCYTVETSIEPEGTLTLALKVVVGSPADEIRIGMVRLERGPGAKPGKR